MKLHNRHFFQHAGIDGAVMLLDDLKGVILRSFKIACIMHKNNVVVIGFAAILVGDHMIGGYIEPATTPFWITLEFFSAMCASIILVMQKLELHRPRDNVRLPTTISSPDLLPEEKITQSAIVQFVLPRQDQNVIVLCHESSITRGFLIVNVSFGNAKRVTVYQPI